MGLSLGAEPLIWLALRKGPNSYRNTPPPRSSATHSNIPSYNKQAFEAINSPVTNLHRAHRNAMEDFKMLCVYILYVFPNSQS